MRTEIFDGFSFVSASYFEFILKLKYVFVKCLTSVKLAVSGNSLIQRMYHSLCESIDVRRCIQLVFSGINDSTVAILLDDPDAVNKIIMDDIITYLIQTYYHMRGKDFSRHIMQLDLL